MKCPNCGCELPAPSHFGLKAHPKNYIAAPIELYPGLKYRRRFSLLYYPPKTDPEHGHLSQCVVIASEEVPKDNSRTPFIAGSKFYENELEKLSLATTQLLAAEIAFRSLVLGRPTHSIFNSRINTLCAVRHEREALAEMTINMYDSMKRCMVITANEAGKD